MAEGRWTEKQRVLVRVWVQDYVIRMHGRPFDKPLDTEIDELLDAVFPVGEPDASQKTINGLLDAVERLNGQKDALRRENGQLRELLDLPVGERVEAVAELVGEPDDERLEREVKAAIQREFRSKPQGWSDDSLARAAVAAVRAAGAQAVLTAGDARLICSALNKIGDPDADELTNEEDAALERLDRLGGSDGS